MAALSVRDEFPQKSVYNILYPCRVCIVFSEHGKVVLSYEKRKLIIFTLHIYSGIVVLLLIVSAKIVFERKSYPKAPGKTLVELSVRLALSFAPRLSLYFLY